MILLFKQVIQVLALAKFNGKMSPMVSTFFPTMYGTAQTNAVNSAQHQFGVRVSMVKITQVMITQTTTSSLTLQPITQTTLEYL